MNDQLQELVGKPVTVINGRFSISETLCYNEPAKWYWVTVDGVNGNIRIGFNAEEVSNTDNGFIMLKTYNPEGYYQ